MHILITGGTGFIGTELRSRLLQEGHSLTIITRSPKKYEDEKAKNQQFIAWDDDLVPAMEEADAVVNLVGENLAQIWTEEVKKRLVSSRVDNTQKLISAIKMAENPPDVMVSASGISYYGDRGDDILDESEPAGSGFLPELCIAWEDAAKPVQDAGVRLVIFRNGVVLQKGGGAMQYMLPVFKLGLGGSIGDGKQYFPWIHMLDACRAMEFAISNEQVSGIYNLNAPNPVTMNELVDKLGGALRRPTFFRVPEFALKWIVGEASAPLLDSLRTQPKKLQQAGFDFRFPYIKEALADIV